MIDRRGMRLQTREGLDDVIVDRFKYDQDEDEDEVPTYLIDPFDIASMRYRASVSGPPQAQFQLQRRSQLEGTVSNAQAPTSIQGSSSIPRQPGPD